MTERQIFEMALQISDVEARQVWIDQACAADVILRDRVKALLAEHAADSQFANSPAGNQPGRNQPTGSQSEDPFDPRITGQTSLFPAGGPNVADAAGSNAPLDDSDDDSETAPDLSFLSPSASPGSIGKLGHYEILQVLGQGAFGIVFKAFDEKLHRLVAIKVINPQLAATSPPRKRFLREARSAAAIKHDNIVQVYSVEEQPLPYLVMEYVDGPTLQQKLDGAGPLELPEILHLGRQMASGLAAAHARGLIHRDIKPGNILLERGAEQRVKITDFGLARAADDASMTSTGIISGTPMYMAPEQAMGQVLDHRADLFSLGSVLYQMASGRPPFRGPTAIAVLKRVADETPRPIPDIISDVPVWLCEIIEKLHAKKPEDRFQTAKEVADLLSRFQTNPPTSEERESQRRASGVSRMVKPVEASEDNKPPEQAVQNQVISSSTNGKPASPLRWLIPLSVISFAILAFLITQLNRSPKQTDAELANAQSEISNLKSQIPDKAGWQGWPADAPPPAIAPFDATQAKQHQKAWADYLKVPVEYTNSIGMKFVLIPPGVFMMGSSQVEIDAALSELSMQGETFKHYEVWRSWINSEAPHHQVILTKPIYTGVYEVTRFEYEKVMRYGQNDSSFVPMKQVDEKVGEVDTNNHPVGEISWNDAVEFCTKMSQIEKLKPYYFQSGEGFTILNGTGYRLPSEAEWEFACRSGMTTRFWNGENAEDLIQAGWFDQNSGGRTHAVGKLKANPFGLRDVHGNVYEWVQDWWEPEYSVPKRGTPAINPTGPISDRSERVFRGGGWSDWTSNCRASMRYAKSPTTRHHDYGFRVSLGLDAVRPGFKVTDSAIPKPVVNTPSDPALAAIDFAAERKAAEWAIKVGGIVWLADEQGQDLGEFSATGPAIPSGRFSVTLANFLNIQFDYSGFANLAACRRIQVVNLRELPVTDEIVSLMDLKPPLHQLQLFHSKISDATLRKVAKISSLRVLKCEIMGDSITDLGLESLAEHGKLQILGLGSKAITRGGIQTAVIGNPDLAILQLEAETPDDAFYGLAKHPKLWQIVCAGRQLDEQAVAVLNSLPNFGSVALNTPWSDESFQQIAKLENLAHLHLGSGMDEPGMLNAQRLQQLRKLVKLSNIHINVGPFDDAGLMELSNIGALKALDVANNSLTNQGIAAFRKARPDVELHVNGKHYPADPKAAIDYAAERKAAEWVLSTGGNVQLHDVDDKQLPLVDGKLPEGRFTLVTADPASGPGFSDDGLANLRPCGKLESINIHMNSRVSDAGIAHLENIRLKTLVVSHCPRVTDKAIRSIARISSLTHLDLGSPGFSDTDVSALEPLKQLQSVRVDYSSLTDHGLVRLAEACPKLTYLSIGNDDGKRSVRTFERFRNLGVVYINGHQLTDEAVAVLNAHPTIAVVYLDSPLDDQTIHRLKGLQRTGLIQISSAMNEATAKISETAYSDAVWPECVFQLSFLGVNASPRDRDLVHFAKLPKLKVLTLDAWPQPNYTAAGIAKFHELRPDVQLIIGGKDYATTKVAAVPNVTRDIDFAAERKVAERLLRLGKGSANLGNKDRQFIGHLKEPLPSEPFCILALDFSGADLSDDELAAASGCREIEKLIFNGNHKITAAGLKHLGILPHLKELLIDSTQVGDEVIEWLANTPSLNRLQATNTPISAAGWTRLPSCSRLRQLDTSFQVDDAGLRRIAERCPELRELYCLSRSVQDLTPLPGLVRLRSLHLSAELLTDAAIDTLLKLPVLDELFVDYPDEPSLMRIKRIGPKLTRLTFRDSRDGSSLASSEKWTAVTEMRGLLELTISGKIPVDGAGLRRIATMPNLQRLHIGADLDAEQTVKFRTFTSDDVLTFRKTRPDVELSISWQKFPALADWPGKFEGSTSIQAWPAAGPESPEPAIGNFSPEIAKQHQANWAKHLKVQEEITNAIGMKFRLIPPGESEFNVGTPAGPKLALKRVTSPYYMGTTEVTVGQFKKFVNATGYQTEAEKLKNGGNLQFQPDRDANWKTPGYVITDDLPVNNISAADAVAFCDWLSESDLKSEIAELKSLYRLPTELEWELACRAGGIGDFGFAGTATELLDYAWMSNNVTGKPTPVQAVATKRENPFGLHDVLGNVWEWYTTDEGRMRGATGGAFNCDSSNTTTSYRALGAGWVLPNVGFRVLRQLQASPPSPKFGVLPMLVPRNTPLGPQTAVTRPESIPGIRSWTVELAGQYGFPPTIAWGPNTDMIATSTNDMSIRLWNRDGTLKSILFGHAGGASNGSASQGRFVTFSPDGARLATVDMADPHDQSELRIWNVATGACHAVLRLPGWGQCVAWSPDGKFIAYGGPGAWGHCSILNVSTGQTHPVAVKSSPQWLTWSADSRFLCLPEKGLPTLFEASTGQMLTALSAPDAQPDQVLAEIVEWSPNGRWLAGAHGTQVRLWDAQSREHLRTFSTENIVTSIAWHKASQLLAIFSLNDMSICMILDTSTGETVARGPSPDYATGLTVTNATAWSPDGKELVAHVRVPHFIDGTTGKLKRSGLALGQSRFDHWDSVSLSSDGAHLHAKKAGAIERLDFDSETGRLVNHRKSPEGYLLTTAPNEHFRVYEKSETGATIEPTRLDQDSVTLTTPGISRVWRSDGSGERVAQAFGQQVRIWNATTGQPSGTLQHPCKVWSFEWSPDGKQIATVAEDKKVRLWDVFMQTTMAEFHRFPYALSARDDFGVGTSHVAWTLDGTGLWIPLGTHVGLLNLKTGDVAPTEHFVMGNPVGSLTLAPDGDRLLVRGDSSMLLRDREGSHHHLSGFLGMRPTWHPDARRILGSVDQFGIRGYDVGTRRRMGTLWPVITGNHWLCIGPTGHYRGSAGVEEHIVYVAQLDDGSNITLSPAEFAKRFGWKNDPDKATLLKLE